MGSLTVVATTNTARASDKPFAATFSPSSITVGVTPTTVAFSVTIANEAPQPQTIGSANVTAPSGITLLSATQPAVGNATIAGNVLQLRNLVILPGSNAKYSYTASVPPPPTQSPVVYTWGIKAKQSNDFNGTGNDFNLDTANSQLKLTVNATPRADLAVAFGNGSTPGDQPDPATPNNDVLYTLKVTNNGPTAESSVTLNESIGGGGTISQIPATGSGTGWTCSASGSTATCSYGALASGASTVIQAWVHAPASSSSVSCGSSTVTGLCNTATVSGSQPDSVSSNNTAREATTVSAAACPAGDTTCARSFINYNVASTVSTGSVATAANWLIGTIQFPATPFIGGQLYNMDALNVPGTYCPASATGGLGSLTVCTFEMDIDTIPSQYAGTSVTMNLECDQSKCPVSTTGSGGFVLVKVSGTSEQILPRCTLSPTSLCYETSLGTSGNFQVTVRNMPAGDPKYAGKCYVQCTPAIP